MNGSMLNATVLQPCIMHTVVHNTMLPTGDGLKQKIAVTNQWNELLASAELEGRLPDLLNELEKLPSEDVVVVRQAIILFRMGRRIEAVNILGRHKNSILAKAWDFAFKVNQGQISKIEELEAWEKRLHEFRVPDGREVTHEGALRMHLSFLSAYVSLGCEAEAYRHAELARRYIFVLQDHSTELVVKYELVGLLSKKGRLHEAMTILNELSQEAKELRPMLYQTTALMLVWGAYLSGFKADLPDWGQKLLEGLKSYQAVEVKVLYNGIKVVTQVFALLRALTSHWVKHFPVYTIRENKQVRDQFVQGILDLKSDTKDGTTMFFLTACKALALSMQGSDDALESIEELSVQQNQVLECLRLMVLIQVHANLPNAPAAAGLKDLPARLRINFMSLSLYEQNLVIDWGKRFLPYAIWLLNGELKDLRLEAAVSDFLMIDDTKEWVRFKGVHLTRYPKGFLQKNVLDLLHGKEVNKNEVDQGRRHLAALQKSSVKVEHVIFMVVLRQIEPKMNCKVSER